MARDGSGTISRLSHVPCHNGEKWRPILVIFQQIPLSKGENQFDGDQIIMLEIVFADGSVVF